MKEIILMPLLHLTIETETGRVVESRVEKPEPAPSPAKPASETGPVWRAINENAARHTIDHIMTFVARAASEHKAEAKLPSTGNRPNIRFYLPGYRAAVAVLNIRSGRIEIYIPDPQTHAKRWPDWAVPGNEDQKTKVWTPYGVATYMDREGAVNEALDVFKFLLDLKEVL